MPSTSELLASNRTEDELARYIGADWLIYQDLEDLISARQAAVSQQLSRLRLEGLVIPRRDGKTIYYRLADDKPKRVLEVVYDLFCNPKNEV